MAAIDLNADLGEAFGVWSLGDDEAMLDVVTSANIACGFHAGDPSTMRRVCQAAADRHVQIGAQVAYPDLVGFGRRFIDIDPGELRDAVLYQLGALDGFAQVAGTGVAYVKPHGALYHACITHPDQAEAVATPHTSTTRRWRCSAHRGRRCSRSPTRSAWSRSPRRSPTAPTAATARSCREPSRTR